MTDAGVAGQPSTWSGARVITHAPAARRVRISVPGLLQSAPRARRIEQRLRATPGVEQVEASHASGRVLVCYAPGAPFLDGFAALTNHLDGDHDGEREPAAVAPEKPLPGWQPSGEGWHALPVEDVLRRLDSAEGGISTAEAARRLVTHGANVIEPLRERSRLEILAGQLANVPTVLLLGSAGISLILGDLIEAAAIVVVVAANTAVGYRIERRQESLLAYWRRLEAGQALVLRDGSLQAIAAADLVPGDVLACRAGDVIPADARVITAHRLACEEASLTGEGEARDKNADPVAGENALADRHSLVHAGTTVSRGHGRAVVLATGPRTELGKVRALVDTTASPPTPLERQLDEIGRRATVVSLGAAATAACAGLLRGRPALTMLRNAVALGVAAIPEGLPLVATSTLVRTMRRLRRRGMVVRRVASAEALGSVTVVCADKTGTLTRNEMRLETLDVDGGALPAETLRARPGHELEDPATLALALGVLNSVVDYHQEGENGFTLSGSSTEQALVMAARDAGLDPDELCRRYPRRALHERHDRAHYVLSLHDAPDGGQIALMKGAPEQVLDLCTESVDGAPLDEEKRARWLARNDEQAAAGLRMLALAWRRVPADAGPEALSNGELHAGYRFVGLASLRDPLRPGAAAAIGAAMRAGIRPIMLTGDQRTTAAAIAAQLGLVGEVIDGGDLVRGLEAGEPRARARLARVAVLARVTPADKLAIVRALREGGELVAMVGDGINDAPALKIADVGVAVGAGANDLTRHTADLFLEHEDLTSILEAIGEARMAQDNLRRAMKFLLATNLSELGLMVGGALFGLEPLSPLQLLWVNLLTDTFPALSLALAPRDATRFEDVASTRGGLLSRQSWNEITRDAGLMAIMGGVGFALGGPAAAFTTLVGAQLCHAWLQRAPDAPAAGRGSTLGLAVGGSLALQLLAFAVPPLRGALGLGGSLLSPVLGTVLGFAAPLAAHTLAERLRGVTPRPTGLLAPLTN